MEEVTRVAMAIIQSNEPLKVEGRLEKIAIEVFSSYEQRTGTKTNVEEMKKLLVQSFSHFKCCVDSLTSKGNLITNSQVLNLF